MSVATFAARTPRTVALPWRPAWRLARRALATVASYKRNVDGVIARLEAVGIPELNGNCGMRAEAYRGVGMPGVPGARRTGGYAPVLGNEPPS